MGSPVARLKLPAKVQSLQSFHQFVRDGAEAAGLESEEMGKLELVLEEILVNVARYAYDDGAGEVEVAYSTDGRALLIEVIDRGRGFNPLEAAPPDLSLGLAERPIGGLGVVLVKQIVGSLHYRRENGQNTVSFRFPAERPAGT